VLGRLDKLVLMESSRLFFESEGFNVLIELKKGKSVLCDLMGLDEHTMGTISKIIFSKVFNMHKKGELKGSTFMMIDEAKLIKIPNLTEIIEQARKFKLGLVLICQYVQQFENRNLELAINNTIVTKIKFQNETGKNAEETKELESLKTRHFNYKTRGFEYKNVKTIDYGEIVKKYEPVETGLTTNEIEARMKAKKDNIYNYFININILDYEPKIN
jgi:type IV secretory pathway TraG/TraD family ATPase VirD4